MDVFIKEFSDRKMVETLQATIQHGLPEYAIELHQSVASEDYHTTYYLIAEREGEHPSYITNLATYRQFLVKAVGEESADYFYKRFITSNAHFFL